VKVKGKSVLLSRRFDRRGARRVHFASALTLLGLADGERASYPETADILQREGSAPRRDAEELFRRMVFNICIANVDDHLRNHGFFRDASGWTPSPAYDLNPVPAEIRPRILTTNVTLDDPTGSLDAARTSATVRR
jgi:serine/threonine-protein kinase HipA